MLLSDARHPDPGNRHPARVGARARRPDSAAVQAPPAPAGRQPPGTASPARALPAAAGKPVHALAQGQGRAPPSPAAKTSWPRPCRKTAAAPKWIAPEHIAATLKQAQRVALLNVLAACLAFTAAALAEWLVWRWGNPAGEQALKKPTGTTSYNDRGCHRQFRRSGRYVRRSGRLAAYPCP